MHYMLLVYEAENWEKRPKTEQDGISDQCWAWHDALVKSGHDRGAAGLLVSAARTLREKDGEVVATDGPFAETKEVLGGFQTVECKDIAEAIAIAKTFPALRAGFAMEVRPVLTDEGVRNRYKE